ncbi:hypothetical protein MUK42_11765 [Musa troglodytarum]|uniref:Uncharacterized protein n=1 Tax=Musa troglodytarum TaxID=320322 RepID=A0A9E7HY16_9LILI|nr:hypothetical protein MUK42_11765 [Musa troglodytarum]
MGAEVYKETPYARRNRLSYSQSFAFPRVSSLSRTSRSSGTTAKPASYG